MYIRTLELVQFKNIARASLSFSPAINGLVGANGAGKTNVLDGIHFVALGRSAFGMSDGQCIRHEADGFVVDGACTSDAGRPEQIVCTFARKGGKSLRRNGKEYERLADHVGMIPVVVVSPADSALISEAADERRRYLNAFLSQIDRGYLSALMRYNTALAERNGLLKQSPSPAQDELLEVLDQQLIRHGTTIHAARAALVEQLEPIVVETYAALCEGSELIRLGYHSEINDRPYDELLRATRERDRINQFTTSGIHRDDLRFTIDGHPLRRFGSQGQQKSFLLALKMAQYTLITRQSGERPVLLLDDLFDKLDSRRVESLIKLVASDRFGQIFITDCSEERLDTVLRRAAGAYALFRVADGNVQPHSACDVPEPF